MKTNSERFLVCLVIVLVQLGLAGVGVFTIKFGKEVEVDVFVFVLIRDFFSLIIIVPFTFIVEKKITIPKKCEIRYFVAMGFVGQFAARLTGVWAFYYTSVSIAVLVFSMLPIWTFVIAICARVEQMPNIRTLHGLGRLIGVLFSVLGSVLIVVGGDFQMATKSITLGEKIFGYICLLLNCPSFAIYLLIQRRYMFTGENSSRWRKNPFSMLSWNYAFGQVFLLLSNIYNIAFHPERFTGIKFNAIYGFLYGILIQSVFCFGGMIWVNKKVSATFVTSFWPLFSLFGMVLGYLFMGDRLRLMEIAGAIVIILSFPCVIWANFREEKIRLQHTEQQQSLVDINNMMDQNEKTLDYQKNDDKYGTILEEENVC